MSIGHRLARLEATRPAPPAPVVILSDEEVRLGLRALLARVGEDGAFPPTPPRQLVGLVCWAGRALAAGPAPPGAGRLGDHWSEDTAAVLDALLMRWADAVARGIWPNLDMTERGSAMNLSARLRRLEEAQDTGAPDACIVYEDGMATVFIYATGERLPLEEYRWRWPEHPVLKAYLTWRLLEAV